MAGKKMRLSQCMIVKNEEANIEKALSWGKEVVCEQIVVDTGSTDRTVELARAMGAKVYTFPWIDDFAAAKNFAISKAAGDWIAFLDADEYFASGDEKKLITLLEKIEQESVRQDVILVTLMDVDENGKGGASRYSPRVFRNISGLKYTGRIHEHLVWNDGDEQINTVNAAKMLTIYHTGYQKEMKAKKGTRNLELLQKELEINPNDKDMLGYLGDEYFWHDQMDEAIESYWKAIAQMPERCAVMDQRSAKTFSNLMNVLLVKEEYAQVEKVYRIAESHMPEEPDFPYFYGVSLVQMGLLKDGIAYLELGIKRLEENSSCVSNCLSSSLQNVYVNLARAYLELKNGNKTVEYCVQLLKVNSGDAEALQLLLAAFRGEGEVPIVTPEQTVEFVGKICDLTSLRGRYLLLRVAQTGVYPELVQYIERYLFSQEEKAALKAAGL